jgi:hypothetical protein
MLNGSGTQASPWNNLATVNGTTFAAGDQILFKRGPLAEDEWKIKPNLTLNYGLRYEYYTPLREDRHLQHQTPQPFRLLRRHLQQRDRAEREPDCIDGLCGHHIDHPGREIVVRVRIVRLLSAPMTQQVDAAHRTARVPQQLGEAVPLPGRFERATPAMHENHRRRHGATVSGCRALWIVQVIVTDGVRRP